MTRDALKSELLDLIASLPEAEPPSEEQFTKINALVDALKPHSPVPDPLRQLPAVEGPWENLFAHFGARHMASKARIHEASLAQHSFNKLPAVTIRTTGMVQEVHGGEQAWNNVVPFETLNGAATGVVITRGTFEPDAENPQRAGVGFWRVEVAPTGDSTEASLRTALGFDDAQPMAVEFKPPKLHSDVVYLDDDLRINIGSMGGLYVLKRVASPGVSVRFA
jgi:hypothetical protein